MAGGEGVAGVADDEAAADDDGVGRGLGFALSVHPDTPSPTTSASTASQRRHRKSYTVDPQDPSTQPWESDPQGSCNLLTPYAAAEPPRQSLWTTREPGADRCEDP
jgi:hypothetical protein